MPVVFGGCVAYLIGERSAVFAAMKIIEEPEVPADRNISKTDALTDLVVNFPCAQVASQSSVLHWKEPKPTTGQRHGRRSPSSSGS